MTNRLCIFLFNLNHEKANYIDLQPMKLFRASALIILLLAPILTFGQVNADEYRLVAEESTSDINIDGNLEEEIWLTAPRAKNFHLTFPIDSGQATSQTEVMIAYDEANLYVGGICYENSSKEHIIQSLRRDYSFGRNESLNIYIDPYDDYTNGFTFGLTPYGVMREGLLNNGSDISDDWDNKWFAEVNDYGDRWTFEMQIPFKTIRYDQENKEWNIIFLRKDLKNNEESSWAPIPLGYRGSDLAFSGKLIFDEELNKAGPNIAFIPFISAQGNKDFVQNESDENFEVGFDAKVGVSSSLNLDLTYNPDFSQVEVDRQVTNLSRFEIFFPERRQFFLENQDLFSEGGFGDSRPFFSRRIGIASDTAGNQIQVPIQYGARLSGKVGQNWRIGLLNMQTKQINGAVLPGAERPDDTFKLLAQNYTVGVIQKRVFARSNIGLTFVNRQALNYGENSDIASTTAFNRTLGVDYNLASDDGRWEGDFFYHHSFDPTRKDDSFNTGAFLGYNTTNLRLRVITSAIGGGFNAETGFVPRKDIVRIGTFNDYDFYPKNSFLIRHGPGLNMSYRTDTQFNITDRDFSVDYDFVHQNTSRLSISVDRNYVLLRSPFDPTSQLPDSLSDQRLEDGTDYSWNRYSISYQSDARRRLSFDANFSDGGFFNGKRLNISGRVNFRYQPYGLIALSVDYNNLYSFPEPFAETEFWLVGPRIDLTFTDKLFLTTFVQYNEQADNINLNARFQWRYKPVSDLFVVYTDNYFPDTFDTRNRAIVFKLTYWLNI